MKRPERRPLHHYWAPKYWPTWIGIGLLRLSCLLPFRLHIGLGKLIGRLAHRIGAERRAITRRNIELCFPEFSAEERNQLAREHFEALGASLMEMALTTWRVICRAPWPSAVFGPPMGGSIHGWMDFLEGTNDDLDGNGAGRGT